MKKTVIELFAGVGGFRVGLNNITKIDKNGHAIENGPFTFVWANQWEPATKIQDAFNCYNTRFKGDNNIYCIFKIIVAEFSQDICLSDLPHSIQNKRHSVLFQFFPGNQLPHDISFHTLISLSDFYQ